MVDGHPEEVVALANPAIDAAVRTQISSQNLVGVVVGVAKNGEVTYAKGYGWEDIEDQRPVLAGVTRFRWASVSKTIAGVISAKLAAQGTLNLDQDIKTYWPTYNVPSTYLTGSGTATIPIDERRVTTRRLLSHTAGIMHYSNGQGSAIPSGTNNRNTNTGIEWAVFSFINKPLVGIPGRAYSYSTFGPNLAGVVMEHVSGQTFANLARTFVSEPAGAPSIVPDYEWQSIAHRATGYLVDAGGNASDVGSSDVSWKLPGGGFISTGHDFARYCAALMDGRIMSDTEKSLAWSNTPLTGGGSSSYGLGFDISSRNGRPAIQHSGSQQKTRTQLRYYRNDGLCVVAMTNTEGADPVAIANAVEDAVRAQ